MLRKITNKKVRIAGRSFPLIKWVLIAGAVYLAFKNRAFLTTKAKELLAKARGITPKAELAAALPNKTNEG